MCVCNYSDSTYRGIWNCVQSSVVCDWNSPRAKNRGCEDFERSAGAFLCSCVSVLDTATCSESGAIHCTYPLTTGFFDQNEINKIMEESVKMKHFKHPNVMSLIGVCTDAGPAPYIVMPFMANGSLLSYLRKERRNILLKETADDDLVRAYNVLYFSPCHASNQWRRKHYKIGGANARCRRQWRRGCRKNFRLHFSVTRMGSRGTFVPGRPVRSEFSSGPT